MIPSVGKFWPIRDLRQRVLTRRIKLGNFGHFMVYPAPEVISLLHVNSFMVVKTFLAGLLVEFLVRPVFILVTDLTLFVKLKFVQYRLSFSLTLFAFFPMNS